MHFLSKLHNNSILTGAVDSYCLVCENYLRSEDEAYIHTGKPVHKKNLDMAVRVEKFSEDWIVKVKKGYYCPFCNILLSTTTKVSIHIVDANHRDNKKVKLLRRDDGCITYGEVAITPESWHGIMDTTCIICNFEFDKDERHEMDNAHVLKLIQSRCEFGEEYVYRTVDEDSFFCLICGGVYSIIDKLDHHLNNEHIKHYRSLKEFKKNLPQILQVQDNKSEVMQAEINMNKNTATKAQTISKPVSDKTENVDLHKTENIHTKKNEKVTKKYDKEDSKNIKQETETFQDKESVNKGMQNKTANNKNPISTKQYTIEVATKIPDEKKVTEKLNQKKAAKVANGLTVVNGKTESQSNEKQDTEFSSVLDRVDEFQKKGINIDFTYEKARCKRCNENIVFKSSAIEKHIQQHTAKPKADNNTQRKADKTKKADNLNSKKSKKLPPNLEKPLKKVDDNNIYPKEDFGLFAKENQIAILPNEAYCLHCKISISLGLEQMIAHVGLTSHKENVSKDNGSPLGNKTPSINHMESIVCLKINLDHDIVVNDKYFLRLNSFHCIVPIDERYRCMLCEVDFMKSSTTLAEHVSNSNHKNKLSLCLVVSSLSEEYVREINSGVYHCGYCNEVYYDWLEMEEKHLTSATHRYARRIAKWDLDRSRPVLRNCELVEVRSMPTIN